ncbi:hypothetical protein SmJEL517_g05964 [Synchytrium microbalum]|uniref:AB hydrolase-1 domain-containing protein n=1 Tax=Synchytrium microbalum TaxID=1806994 RepID=A0A507BYY6_9FUNG|nr:uncharacterized protein SmJEL517_g05964 [Synchytrium microbalum]TPX30483.1 hypothetical protein SmJEL517_g05964 [Synchytrium microbalum]
MEGKLFTYDSESRYVAFESNSSLPNKTIFIPGLTDGLNALPYLPLLTQQLASIGYSLIQPILPSSYLQYGISSLSNDCKYIDKLIKHVLDTSSVGTLVLIGHSTGCQQILYYMKHGEYTERISAVVLQGAVSDREFFMWDNSDQTTKYVHLAKSLNVHDLLPRDVDIAPMTAGRYLSLATRLGLDDMFSSDLTDAELINIFSGLGAGVNVGICFSGADEYVPPSVDPKMLLQRWTKSTKEGVNVAAVIIPDADHELSTQEAQEAFCKHVLQILTEA